MPAGSIHIDLYHRSGNVTGVQIASSRPDNVAKILIGKTPEQVLDTVPLLFTLCGNAQAYAALRACRAALGIAVHPALDSARDMLVQLETLREHAWRILLDWPGFIDQAPDKKALASLLKFDGLFKRHLFRQGEAYKFDSDLDINPAALMQQIDNVERLIDQVIFKGGLADFRQLTNERELTHWLQQNDSLPAHLLNYLYRQDWLASGQSDVACLPELQGDELERQMRQIRNPDGCGGRYETTVLNRQLARPLIAGMHGCYGNGLMVRMLARLLEVALIPCQLRQLLMQIKDQADCLPFTAAIGGIGWGQVQAARGLLIHRLALNGRRVHDYCIVAPTEWNFHQHGVLAQALKNLHAESPQDLQRQAELLISAVDPCVQYALHLTNSA